MAALLLGARLLLGLLFVLAGLAKLADRRGFRRAVRDYGLLPERLVGVVAAALPWVEACAGALLVLGLATTPAAGAVFVLLIAFAAAAAVNLLRGRAISCGCHGAAAGAPISWWLVARNLALALAAGWLVVAPASGTVGPGDAVAVGVGAVALLALARLIGQAAEVRHLLGAPSRQGA